MKTVYACIGNSDDKLTQAEWSGFTTDFILAIQTLAAEVHGEWFSIPSAPYQNCCMCFVISDSNERVLRADLTALRADYGQDSIAWTEAPVTEFI